MFVVKIAYQDFVDIRTLGGPHFLCSLFWPNNLGEGGFGEARGRLWKLFGIEKIF